MSQSAIHTHSQGVEAFVSLLQVLRITVYSSFLTESGNMLIMTYAHARASGDGSLISRYVRTKLLLGTCGGPTEPDSILC